MIVIVDYGIGNTASVKNMLKVCGANSAVSSDVEVIKRADKVILPGVGAFDEAMRRLQEARLTPVLADFVATGRPLLGICLGAQLLLSSSEEGKLAGLNFIRGTCKRFESSDGLKVPHMGWSEVTPQSTSTFTAFETTPRFYFVHSYYMMCESSDHVLGTTHYGHNFASMIGYKNVFGVQFHPEKSHHFGMQLCKNFISL